MRDRIAALIEAQGPISVAQYMSMALGAYYEKANVFGVKGDFITAPEISQMFGEMLGLWTAQVWKDQGSPGKFHLVEFGPGRGTLMADALRAAKKAVPEFDPDVVLVESSANLKKYQEIKLAGARVRWTNHFEGLEGLPLFVIANEFFDALPVRQYVKTEKGWCERMVTQANGVLSFALAPIATPNSVIPSDRHGAEDGAVYEVCPSGIALVGEISRVIADRGGAALIVDYGYGEVGLSETLQAVAGHEYVGLLDTPGEADLSAHVDFPALARAAAHEGDVYGPVDQGAFLNAIGIGERAKTLARANPAAVGEIVGALERLTHPGDSHMGRLFKALSIVPRGAPKPPGF